MKCSVCGKEIQPGAKFCRNCGTELGQMKSSVVRCPACTAIIKPGNRFCTRCGTSISEPDLREKASDSGNKTDDNIRKEKGHSSGQKIIIIMLVVIITILAAGLIYLLWNGGIPEKNTGTESHVATGENKEYTESVSQTANQSKESDTMTEIPENSSSDNENVAENSNSSLQNEENNDNSLKQEETIDNSYNEGNGLVFQDGIYYNPDTVADYSASLDPSEYYTYTEEGGYFTFSYPTTLYNQVYVDHSTMGQDGRISVYMHGSDGSSALFEKIENESNLNELYVSAYESIYDAEDIKYDENNVFIISGYEDSSCQIAVYYLVHRYGNDMYIMQINFPYNGDSQSEDYTQKCYVVENFYRMCGFGGSTYKARTYSQYKSGDRGEKY